MPLAMLGPTVVWKRNWNYGLHWMFFLPPLAEVCGGVFDSGGFHFHSLPLSKLASASDPVPAREMVYSFDFD